jgi:hypothetical protein
MWMNMRQIPAAILRRLADPSAEVFSPKAEPAQLSLAL